MIPLLMNSVRLGLTLLVVHILVYAAFAYLSLRKVFVSLRGTGVFRSCGCRPPTIDQSEDNPKPKSSNLNFNTHDDSFALPTTNATSPTSLPSSTSIAMTLLPDSAARHQSEA
jgi:hypothetical protein